MKKWYLCIGGNRTTKEYSYSLEECETREEAEEFAGDLALKHSTVDESKFKSNEDALLAYEKEEYIKVAPIGEVLVYISEDDIKKYVDI